MMGVSGVRVLSDGAMAGWIEGLRGEVVGVVMRGETQGIEVNGLNSRNYWP